MKDTPYNIEAICAKSTMRTNQISESTVYSTFYNYRDCYGRLALYWHYSKTEISLFRATPDEFPEQ